MVSVIAANGWCVSVRAGGAVCVDITMSCAHISSFDALRRRVSTLVQIGLGGASIYGGEIYGCLIRSSHDIKKNHHPTVCLHGVYSGHAGYARFCAYWGFSVEYYADRSEGDVNSYINIL